MAFPTRPTTEVGPIGSGVATDIYNQFVLSYDTYEDGLLAGRFAKLDTGSLDNLDGSATPAIAGVVLRNTNNPIEDGETFEGDFLSQVDALRHGIVTVEVVAGDTPAKFGPVYAVNAAASGADFGKATTTSTDNVEIDAEWISEVTPGVWTIYMK